MYFDCFLKIPNEWLGLPELKIYTDSDWQRVLSAKSPEEVEAIPVFALNPNYFTLYSNLQYSLVKIRLEKENMMRWLSLVPEGVDPFSMEAVRALDVDGIYLGIGLDEVYLRWPELNCTVPVYDNLGVLIGTEPLIKDTIIV